MKLIQIIKYYPKYLLEKFKTDSIKFVVNTDIDFSEDPEGYPWKHTDIIINNKSLFDRLYDYEVSEAKRTKTRTDLAGKYRGIDPKGLIRTFKRGTGGEISIWQCSICESSLCASDLVCKYKVTPFIVEFYDFRQQSNPMPFNNQKLHEETIEKSKWNYSALRPFKFNRHKFFKELSKLDSIKNIY